MVRKFFIVMYLLCLVVFISLKVVIKKILYNQFDFMIYEKAYLISDINS